MRKKKGREDERTLADLSLAYRSSVNELNFIVLPYDNYIFKRA